MKLVTDAKLTDLTATARESARQRINLNIHKSSEELVQKLFIAATRQSYFRPHRHPNNAEFAIAIRGRFEILEFDDYGTITARGCIGENTNSIAVEIVKNTWHCWRTLSEEGVFFETKQGPYSPDTSAEFPAWAPVEGSREVAEYLLRLDRI
jgi:cupin fold WbuC family metalloprotein